MSGSHLNNISKATSRSSAQMLFEGGFPAPCARVEPAIFFLWMFATSNVRNGCLRQVFQHPVPGSNLKFWFSSQTLNKCFLLRHGLNVCNFKCFQRMLRIINVLKCFSQENVFLDASSLSFPVLPTARPPILHSPQHSQHPRLKDKN